MKNSYYVFGVSSVYQQAWKSYKLYLLVCVFEKQITFPSEDTVIFIGQMKWAWCLLFLRSLHSCFVEFCWDLGCYHDLGLAPCRAVVLCHGSRQVPYQLSWLIYYLHVIITLTYFDLLQPFWTTCLVRFGW